MKAGIIAAGKGERLAAGGFSVPKPLVPLLGEPMIGRLIRVAADTGVTSLCCIINEQSRPLEEYLLSRPWPLRLQVLKKTTDNSMESLFALAPFLQGEPFVLFTVDTVFRSLTLKRFLSATAALPPAQAILALTRYSDDEKPLRVEIDRDHRVRRIGHATEKGRFTAVTAGFYWFDPSVFDLIDRARQGALSALRQFLSLLLEAGCGLYGVSVAKTIDVDRPEDVSEAENFLERYRDVKP
ncbi:MAG: NDP-sugar synthase [Syntrophorhabdales bacterium]|jgi:NDP-sugar pyrophosphorylase family protein